MQYGRDDTLGRNLWASLVALQEAADIAEKLAPDYGVKFFDEARRRREQAAVLKTMLNRSSAE
jgi:hypothetical protein